MSRENADAVVLSSRVRLARNYEDFPFDLGKRPDIAGLCVSRTANALRLAGEDRGYRLQQLSEMSRAERESMVEYHLISKDLLKYPETAAVLVREDEGLTIMMNEEDHLRIQSVVPGDNLQEAADRCFHVEDALSRQVAFAYDSEWGYLTAMPTNTGTGMRASLLLHLPMLTLCKQMGNVGQIVAKVGLTIRGVYGEGSEALGCLYQLSNQVTLGRTEQELMTAVTAVGDELTGMETELRRKHLEENSAQMEDVIWRAWAILSCARLMPLQEFFGHWSNVRMGCAMGILPAPLADIDRLLEDAQDANLRVRSEKTLDEDGLCALRADLVRGALQA